MNDRLEELIKNQLNCPDNLKLKHSDLLRITKYTDKSLFGNECCIWKGYITETKNSKYINFYFNKKKLALHRILYNNYIGSLGNEYLDYSCKNKNICCNINHIKKKKCETISCNIKENDKIIYF